MQVGRPKTLRHADSTVCAALTSFRVLPHFMTHPLRSIIRRAGLIAICSPLVAGAFDYDGHRMINQLALASLPTNFPAFVSITANAERVAFLGGEPDRWRNSPDNTFKHWNAPDHFFDIEDLAPLRLSIDKLPAFRHAFTMELGVARARYAGSLPAIDPARNQDHTRELIGFLPWTIAEHFSRLKSAFSALQAFEEAGTPEEIANAQANVVHFMGVMGHYVADAVQPLHTTRHYNGWVGENPKGFSTSKSFHAWIDGGYLARVPVNFDALKGRLRKARLLRNEARAAAEPSVFAESLAFIREQHRLVEPLYQLDKDGQLSPDRPGGQAGRAFFEKQFLTGAQMLGDLWFTAWREAPPDNFLKSALARRKLAAGKPRS